MSELKLAVVEDSDEDFSLLSSALNRFFKENDGHGNIIRFVSGEEFLKAKTNEFDLVFMDILLPGENGMEIAKKLRLVNKEILLIFLTNMSQYAIEGYSVNALDYILKPLNYYSFDMKMERAIHLLDNHDNSNISVKYNGGTKFLPVADIIYVQVMGHDVTFYGKETSLTSYGNLKEYEQELKKYHFSRCSATALINLKYVDGLFGDDVLLKNGTRIPIGRSKKKSFLSDLSLYLGGNL